MAAGSALAPEQEVAVVLDTLERSLRRWAALAWLLPAAMAVHGAWRGRRAAGRTVGRPFAELPRWLLAGVVPAYLALVVRLWRPLPGRLSPGARLTASAGGAILTVGGIGLVVWGRAALGAMYNVSSVAGVRLNAGHELVTTGPFAFVRHPIYLGAYIAGAGSLLLYRTWAVAFMLAHCAVFAVRAGKEEQALAAEFGTAWDAYCRRVPAWLPRLTPSPIAPVAPTGEAPDGPDAPVAPAANTDRAWVATPQPSPA